jgi:serine/threonine-protein kinase SRPK3
MPRYVAFKALTNSATIFLLKGKLLEKSILERISEPHQAAEGLNHCMKMFKSFTQLDYFKWPGYDKPAPHMCFITELMGPDMTLVREQYRGAEVPLHLVKRIVRHLLLALDYLHRECGVVHTGLLICFIL